MSYPDHVKIVYDGDCPFCRRYVNYLRLKDAIGVVEMINAREHPNQAAEYKKKGYDLDEGMVAELDGKIYHGDEAVHILAMLTTPSTFFNKMNAWLFKSECFSKAAYPVLRAGRNMALKIKGSGQIHSA